MYMCICGIYVYSRSWPPSLPPSFASRPGRRDRPWAPPQHKLMSGIIILLMHENDQTCATTTTTTTTTIATTTTTTNHDNNI